MMTLETMRRRKGELGYSCEELSALSGLPLSTVQKVMGGVTKAPRRKTIEALERVLAASSYRCPPMDPSAPPILREHSVSFGNAVERRCTVDDLEALPEGCRAELIDGVLYDMGSPSTFHQALVTELSYHFIAYIRSHQGPCQVFSSPGVQINNDQYTEVLPDVVVLCDRSKSGKQAILGAPDLVVEILSPSTASRDRILKLAKYDAANVREYWIVDPKRKEVQVYRFELKHEPDAEDFYQVYSFDEPIPVGIFQGQLEINFPEIITQLSNLL